MTNSRIKYQKTLKELRAVNKQKVGDTNPKSSLPQKQRSYNLKNLDLIGLFVNITATAIITAIIWIIIKNLIV